MKPAPFDYVRAESVPEAVGLLRANDACLIAGGQTLTPMLAMRLLRPELLIDIAAIPELHGIRSGDGRIEIGAATRQRTVERSPAIAAAAPLLAAAMPWVGHVQTRNRGTVGGSLALGDPAAEIPLVAVTLGARISWSGEGGCAADRFFEGPMMTVLPEQACLTAMRLPVWEGRVGAAFEEVAARRGDFAHAAAAVQLQLAPDGTCTRIALGLGGVHPTPLALPGIGDRLVGGPLDERTVRLACADAGDLIEPEDDLHVDAGWRRKVAPGLLARAVMSAGAGP